MGSLPGTHSRAECREDYSGHDSVGWSSSHVRRSTLIIVGDDQILSSGMKSRGGATSAGSRICIGASRITGLLHIRVHGRM